MASSGLSTNLPDDLPVTGLSGASHFTEISRKILKNPRATIVNPETVISSSNISLESIAKNTVLLHPYEPSRKSPPPRKMLQIAPDPRDATPSSPKENDLPSTISDPISNLQEQSTTYDAQKYGIAITQKLVEPTRKKAGSMKRHNSKSTSQREPEATPRRITRSMRKESN